jgi:hypothetical protein
VIRGAPTTHYRGAIDLRKLVARLPSADRAAVSAGLSKLFAQAGVSNIPFDVWVDAHHLVRRMQVSLSLRPNGRPLAFAISVELFGFGPTAPVAAPAPGEVFDATGSVLHGLANSGG